MGSRAGEGSNQSSMVRPPRNPEAERDSRIRLPSLRDPRGFYDLFVIDLVAIGIVALEFAITRQFLVRIEVIGIMIAVFLWNVWGILQILKRAKAGSLER